MIAYDSFHLPAASLRDGHSRRYRALCNLDAQGEDATAAAAAVGRPVLYHETVADVASPVANWRPRPALPPNAVPSSAALMSIVADLQSRQMVRDLIYRYITFRAHPSHRN